MRKDFQNIQENDEMIIVNYEGEMERVLVTEVTDKHFFGKGVKIVGNCISTVNYHFFKKNGKKTHWRYLYGDCLGFQKSFVNI